MEWNVEASFIGFRQACTISAVIFHASFPKFAVACSLAKQVMSSYERLQCDYFLPIYAHMYIHRESISKLRGQWICNDGRNNVMRISSKKKRKKKKYLKRTIITTIMITVSYMLRYGLKWKITVIFISNRNNIRMIYDKTSLSFLHNGSRFCSLQGRLKGTVSVGHRIVVAN